MGFYLRVKSSSLQYGIGGPDLTTLGVLRRGHKRQGCLWVPRPLNLFCFLCTVRRDDWRDLMDLFQPPPLPVMSVAFNLTVENGAKAGGGSDWRLVTSTSNRHFVRCRTVELQLFTAGLELDDKNFSSLWRMRDIM
jgi:hypothetical protein